MGLGGSDGSVERFSIYVEGLASVIGHADRVGQLRDYCTGLMMPCARKSVEPIAAVTAPARTAAQHQSLLHFVGQASWSDEEVLAKVCEMVLPTMVNHGPIEAWIIDDTGFPKKGKYSVGVARQYYGQLGKQDNCQAAGDCQEFRVRSGMMGEKESSLCLDARSRRSRQSYSISCWLGVMLQQPSIRADCSIL